MFPSALSIQEARPALFSTTSRDQATLMLGFSEHVFLPSCIPIKVDILASIFSVFLFQVFQNLFGKKGAIYWCHLRDFNCNSKSRSMVVECQN